VLTGGETPVRFVTLQETHVPAGPGKSVEVPIEAIVAGAQGNVDVEGISALEGALGLSLSVTNAEPTTGGTDSKEIGASEKDRTRLRTVMLENLQSEAGSQLRDTLANGDLLLMDTLNVSNVLVETYLPSEGKPGKQLTLTMKVEFSAEYVSADDLDQLTRGSLDAAVPAGFTASTVAAFEPVGDPKTDADGVSHFELKAMRTLMHQLQVPQVFGITRGLHLENARDRLDKHFSLRKAPEIRLTPSWWPWMPLIPFNVSVEMK
jgi:hypothetical protein